MSIYSVQPSVSITPPVSNTFVEVEDREGVLQRKQIVPVSHGSYWNVSRHGHDNMFPGRMQRGKETVGNSNCDGCGEFNSSKGAAPYSSPGAVYEELHNKRRTPSRGKPRSERDYCDRNNLALNPYCENKDLSLHAPVEYARASVPFSVPAAPGYTPDNEYVEEGSVDTFLSAQFHSVAVNLDFEQEELGQIPVRKSSNPFHNVSLPPVSVLPPSFLSSALTVHNELKDANAHKQQSPYSKVADYSRVLDSTHRPGQYDHPSLLHTYVSEHTSHNLGPAETHGEQACNHDCEFQCTDHYHRGGSLCSENTCAPPLPTCAHCGGEMEHDVRFYDAQFPKYNIQRSREGYKEVVKYRQAPSSIVKHTSLPETCIPSLMITSPARKQHPYEQHPDTIGTYPPNRPCKCDDCGCEMTEKTCKCRFLSSPTKTPKSNAYKQILREQQERREAQGSQAEHARAQRLSWQQRLETVQSRRSPVADIPKAARGSGKVQRHTKPVVDVPLKVITYNQDRTYLEADKKKKKNNSSVSNNNVSLSGFAKKMSSTPSKNTTIQRTTPLKTNPTMTATSPTITTTPRRSHSPLPSSVVSAIPISLSTTTALSAISAATTEPNYISIVESDSTPSSCVIIADEPETLHIIPVTQPTAPPLGTSSLLDELNQNLPDLDSMRDFMSRMDLASGESSENNSNNANDTVMKEQSKNEALEEAHQNIETLSSNESAITTEPSTTTTATVSDDTPTSTIVTATTATNSIHNNMNDSIEIEIEDEPTTTTTTNIASSPPIEDTIDALINLLDQ